MTTIRTSLDGVEFFLAPTLSPKPKPRPQFPRPQRRVTPETAQRCFADLKRVVRTEQILQPEDLR